MEIIPGTFELPLWSVLGVIAIALGYIYSTWTFRTWSRQGIKGPRPWPLFGTFLGAIKAGGLPMYDMEMVKTYGNISGSYRSRTPILDVADPEFLRLTMIKDFASMTNRAETSIGNKILDNFMTSLTDDHWRHVRSSLTPTFTSGKLKQMKAKVDVCGDKFVEHIGESVGEEFDSKKFTEGYTMDVISSTAFGIDVDSQRDPNHPIMENAHKVMGTHQSRSFLVKIKRVMRVAFFLLLPSPILKVLTKFGVLSIVDMEAVRYFETITDRILSDRGKESTKEKDFIQLCLNLLIDTPQPSDPHTKIDEYGKPWSTKGLTKDEIVANAILLFLAGFGTTATTINYALYELAMNADVQERVYDEIMKSKSSDVATYEELAKMEYLDWFINESMRLYPAVPRVERYVSRDTTVEGIHLPAGSMVSAMIYAIHHNPEIWPNPSKFDPERFSPENSMGRHQYAWIPFGIGNRNCIGNRLALLEIKIALVKIVTNFVLEPCEGTPEKPLKFAKNFRMEPDKPIQLKAKWRKANEASLNDS